MKSIKFLALINILLNILILNAFEGQLKKNEKRYGLVKDNYKDENLHGKILEIWDSAGTCWWLKINEKQTIFISKDCIQLMSEEEYQKQKKFEKKERKKINSKKLLVSKFYTKNPFEELNDEPK